MKKLTLFNLLSKPGGSVSLPATTITDIPLILRQALPRGLALFLGGFSLLNLVSHLRSVRLDGNLWWIDLRWLPAGFANAFLLLSAVCLLAFALWPSGSLWRRRLTMGCAAVLALMCVINAAQFYVLAGRGTIHAGVAVPLSLFVAAVLAIVVAGAGRVDCRKAQMRGTVAAALGVCLVSVFIFSLAQMFCFGKTDYRRPADVAVVLGARVYGDGRPSDALADRMRTACQLYRAGLVKKLLVSGGPGDGNIHETEAMKRMAVGLGVKEQDILLDAGGLNTQATVRNSKAVFAKLHASRVLVVSHFYHLPRIKMAYQRAGLDVYTVPARESYFLRQMPFFLAREVAAFWVYYGRGLVT